MRTQGWVWLLAATMVASPSWASPGKVKKAAKLQAAYEAGDREALPEALSVLESAMAHDKVASDPAAWARLGHLHMENARTSSDLAGLKMAAGDLSKSLELGAAGEVREQAVSDLKTILSTLFQRTVDDYESSRIPDAEKSLEAVLMVRQILVDADTTVDAVEDRLLTVGAQVTLAAGRLDDTMGYHDQLEARSAFNASLTAAIAKALNEAQRPDDALALVERMAELHPDSTRLLRAQVDLLMMRGDPASAVAKIDAARDTLWPSVSGAYLMYELYQQADDPTRSLQAAMRVVEQDPRHVDALVGAATIVAGRADSAQARIDGGGLKWSDKKRLGDEVAKDRVEVVRLLEAAKAADPSQVAVVRALAAAHRAQGDEEAANELDAAATALEGQKP